MRKPRCSCPAYSSVGRKGLAIPPCPSATTPMHPANVSCEPVIRETHRCPSFQIIIITCSNTTAAAAMAITAAANTTAAAAWPMRHQQQQQLLHRGGGIGRKRRMPPMPTAHAYSLMLLAYHADDGSCSLYPLYSIHYLTSVK